MRVPALALMALPIFGLGAPAFAGTIVANGDFSSQSVTYSGTGTNAYSPGNSFELGNYGVSGEDGSYTAGVTGWTVFGQNTNPYALWYNNATATTTTALSRYDTVTNGTLGGNEYFRSVPTSNAPSGFVALDSAAGVSSGIAQAVNVTQGTVYQLTFNWAAAQLVTGGGAYNLNLFYTLTNGAMASLTNVPYVTPCADGSACVAQGGTDGWLTQTAYFEATTTGTEYLAFFAISNTGNPPMALLDDVSLVAAPEPGSVAVVLAGVAGLMLVQRRRANLK